MSDTPQPEEQPEEPQRETVVRITKDEQLRPRFIERIERRGSSCCPR